MRRRTIVTSLIALLALSSLLAEPATAGPPPRAPHQIVAELVEAGPEVPDCGTMHFIVVMRYRVAAVTRGDLAEGQEIYVAVSCPEQHGVRFVLGARHVIALQEKRPWSTGALVPNPKMPKPSPLYWALSVEPAPPTPR